MIDNHQLLLSARRFSDAHEEALKTRNLVLDQYMEWKDGFHIEHIQKMLNSMNIETSIQTLNSTDGLVCHNIHGILRAPRGDGKEGIVFVTPLAMHDSKSLMHEVFRSKRLGFYY